MAGMTRAQLAEVRGAVRLLLDGSVGVVDVVERMHRTIQRRPGPVGRAVEEPTRGITGFVYRSVRGGMQLARRGVDRPDGLRHAFAGPFRGNAPAVGGERDILAVSVGHRRDDRNARC